MADFTEPQERHFNLDSFAKAQTGMIATNERAYESVTNSYRATVTKVRDYTTEEIKRIIASGSLVEQQRLSRNYFYKDGYYKSVISYYGTLLKYVGLLIPNVGSGKSLSAPHIQKRYYNALDYLDRSNLASVLTNCAIRALVDGCYFGVTVRDQKDSLSLIDLPVRYCCSRFKDCYGNDLIEFDLNFFRKIVNPDVRKSTLAAYPKCIANAYKAFEKKGAPRWYTIPSEVAVCFPMFDCRPYFLNVISKVIDYEDSVASEMDRMAEDINKVIVQQIPHLTDGRLLFEPDEAEEIHNGTVSMLKGNKNLRVLTSYADVEAIGSNASTDNSDEVLSRMEQNIYAQAGVSSQLFATEGAGLEKSINKDISIMMYLADKFSRYLTARLNEMFGNGNISFKYTILPISRQNEKEYIDNSFKLATSGYSFLLPGMALGFSQRDLTNIKDLENNVLKLADKLIPLSSAYTTSSKDSGAEKALKEQEAEENNGRPQKQDGEKAAQTVANNESEIRTGGTQS